MRRPKLSCVLNSRKPPTVTKKILIIRFSSIGDIVLTTPVVRAVKQQLGAEVHFLTKRPFRAIVDVNPHIDRVYAIDDRVGEVLPDLKKEKYDLIVDLHNNLRSAQVKWGLATWQPATRATTFHKLNLAKWLMVNMKVDRLPRRHIVERYLDTVRPLGVTYDGAGLDYFIPSGEQVDLALLAQAHLTGQPELATRLVEGRYVGLVIGAAHATKRLPADRLVALAQKLPKPVVLLGGAGDAETGAHIAGSTTGVINTCGDYSLHGSASLIGQSAGLITHDTGLMHIGAALRRPMVSVWGNTIPEFGMYPFFPQGEDQNTTLQVSGLGCRPCSKIGYAECPRGHFRCMRDQPLDLIATKVTRFLTANE